MNLPFLFILKKTVATMLLPPTLPLAMAIGGLLALKRYPRAGKRLAWTGTLLALILSLPITLGWLAGPLENFPVPGKTRLSQAQAIVILGGGKRFYAPEFGGSTVNQVTLERVRYGARLAKQLNLPILVTGGAPVPGMAEAPLMADALRNDFSIEPKWVEAHSLDTHENAVYSAKMLQAKGIRRIVLVTHAAHMARAMTEFERAGFEPIAAPTGFFTNQGPDMSTFDSADYLPSMRYYYQSWYVLHEWLGILAQRIF